MFCPEIVAANVRRPWVLPGLIFAVAAGWLSQANATPVAYMLSTDVPGFTVNTDGDTYDVTAAFYWDSTTNLESNVDIILTGTGPEAGTYTSTPAIIAAVTADVPDNKDICGQNGSDAVCLRFVDVLGTVPDVLQIIAFGDQAPDLNAPATGLLNVTNGAEAVLASSSSVPEPTSLSLLGAGLIGGAVTSRRRKPGKARSVSPGSLTQSGA